MPFYRMLPCVECHAMTRADRARCPACQRRANFRFIAVTVMLIVLGALWLLLRLP
jgi:RNA polymerase subunit RPABC4/transcription elongation factor Spt4